MRRYLLAVALLSFIAAAPASSSTEAPQRLALVIGNGAYAHSPLPNPVNDATDMAAVLERSGFEVILKTDAGRRDMIKAMRDFGNALRDSDVGLFYFAGHGLQIDGRNYLIPVGAVLETESDVEFEAVDAGRVLGKMEDAGNGLNIIILDACRDNPFARSFRSQSKGLAKMDAPVGSILAYATAPGSVAADGASRNGLYTSKLIEYIPRPGLKLEDLFKRVRRDVIRDSQERQVPWESSSLSGDFYFTPPASRAVVPVAAAPAPAAQTQLEILKAEKARLEAERARLEAEKKLLQEQQRLEAEKLKMQLEMERLKAEKDRMAAAQELMRERQRQVEARTADAEREQQRLASAQAAGEEAKRQEAEQRRQQMEAELEQLRAEKKRLAAEKDRMARGQETASQEAARIEAKRQEAEQRRQQMEAELAQLRAEKERLAAEKDRMARSQETASQEAARIEAQRRAASEELEKITAQKARIEAQAERMRADLATAGGGEKLALFPSQEVKSRDGWGGTRQMTNIWRAAIMRHLLTLTEEMPDIEFAYSYYNRNLIQDTFQRTQRMVSIADRIGDDPDAFWRRKSFLSNLEPDVPRVVEAARALGVRLVVMYRLHVVQSMSATGGIADLTLYLIDAATEKVHRLHRARIDGSFETKPPIKAMLKMADLTPPPA